MIVAKLHAVQPKSNVRKTLDTTEVFARSACRQTRRYFGIKTAGAKSPTDRDLSYNLQCGSPTTVRVGADQWVNVSWGGPKDEQTWCRHFTRAAARGARISARSISAEFALVL